MSRTKEELLNMVDRMPAFPASVHRIIKLTSDVNCQARDLVRVIDTDPVLTMRILRVANSAYFGLQMNIVSVQHAVVYIGLNSVKHLALATAAIGSLPKISTEGFDADKFLQHSLTVGVLTRRFRKRMGGGGAKEGDEFVAGLLHDIGKVLFAHFEADALNEAARKGQTEGIPVYLAERELLGVDHAEMGGMLAQHWGFPENLCRAIREHHEPIDAEDAPPLRDCVYLANYLAERRAAQAAAAELLGPDAPLPEIDWPPPIPFTLKHFTMGFEDLIAQFHGLEDELERVQALG
ncbi:MAG: HDOD domain-containing protein [Myxococcota bacterium]